MKILMLCPKYANFQGYPPTSLVNIASVAEALGHKVHIIDLNINKAPKERTYDLIAITGLSPWRKNIIETSKILNLPVIVGGPWASLYPKEVLSHNTVNYVCIGEGEETFKEFLSNYPYSNVENVKGIAYKNDKEIHINEPRPFIDDLDSLPLPAWHLVNIRKYRRVSIVTSRSCPFNCIFCSVHTLLGPKWRARSISRVLEEIELVVKYGADHITFGDDCINVMPERLTELCEQIIERKIKATFDIIQGTRADRLPLKLLELMKEANFKEVIIAPESGSQRVLDEIIGKRLDLSTVEPVVEKCRDLGLQCGAFFVIGFPWETMEEIELTVKFADRLRELGCSCYVGNALPYPDTRLYEHAKEEGYLRFDGAELEEKLYVLDKPRTEHCLSSPHWKPEQIVNICRNEWKKNLRSVYGKYSARQILSKLVRHPVRSIRKAIKTI